MFKGQCTPAIINHLQQNNVDIVFVPANCTDPLQPLDVSVNKAAKNFMCDQFQRWYAEQIQQQVQDNKQSCRFETKHKWFVQLSDYLKQHPDKNGFKGAGITAEYLAAC